jgi:hypothetical protein
MGLNVDVIKKIFQDTLKQSIKENKAFLTWKRDVLEKLIVIPEIPYFLIFYGIQKFVTISTKTHCFDLRKVE